ncbi:hypothetical protein [Halodesulfovibrio spirochaetisodalis]|uniref:Uncharacterized protein n=1 Tax=Halodesulfovibrio spirochaetisodalis TaxID=1560234 RepID=A0A1B7XA03_9BACT|nr:hypothetical protein [Halodesulfovibrio spirochaetisodalis]OBQ46120.1 hypothetical protein SP90_14645 [Halodesulfovibrio spirochaetisodalis]
MKSTSSVPVGTPEGPISGALHSYLIEMAAHMQTLPQESFEVASMALKGALAEVARVEELESKITGDWAYEQQNC